MFARRYFITRNRFIRLILSSFLLLGVLSFIFSQISGESPSFPSIIRSHSGSHGPSYKYLNRLGAVPPNSERKLVTTTNASPNQALHAVMPNFKNKGKRPKACFVSLIRNKELDGMVHSIKLVQRRFNNKFKYPWIFLNDEEFTDEFKNGIKEVLPNIEVRFGLISAEEWSLPDFIDLTKAEESRMKMRNTIHGGSASYRYMCRYQSGYFFRHPLLDGYDWYWRVEPYINLCCDVPYDVFQWMQDNEKVYGFVISILEYPETIPTLWSTSMEFFYKYPEYVADNNALEFISDDGVSYNNCHFWSNFEIGNLNFFRSKAYTEYFDYLDQAGGFFYERWGDAPVHSIALAMMLPRDKIHYFSDIGYYHPPRFNCPLDRDVYKERRCTCPQRSDVTFRKGSCGTRWYDFMGLEKPKLWSHMREIDEREERRLAKEKQAEEGEGEEGGAEVEENIEELSEEDRRFMEEDKMLLGRLPVQVEHKVED